MKKQMLIGMGLASMLVLTGCETPPDLKETDAAYSAQNNTDKKRYLFEQPDIEKLAKEVAKEQARAAEEAEKQAKSQAEAQPPRVIVKQAPRQERIKITGVGYGAESVYDGFTDGQKRLMAIRASKLDAYRSLAEQLYGIKIDSNTSIATMTAQSDSFRARVNAVVRGARIVSITPMADNNYETVLEVFVDRRFFEDVFVYSGSQQEFAIEPMETCTLGFNCYEAANYR